MVEHHEKHTGHATKAEQINSFIGERFIGIIAGVLTSGDRCPDTSEGSITLVFECGWGIVFQDVKPEHMWVESPEHLKRTSAVILDYLNSQRETIYPAWLALNPPPTNDEEKAAKPKAKPKAKAKAKARHKQGKSKRS